MRGCLQRERPRSATLDDWLPARIARDGGALLKNGARAHDNVAGAFRGAAAQRISASKRHSANPLKDRAPKYALTRAHQPVLVHLGLTNCVLSPATSPSDNTPTSPFNLNPAIR